MTTFELVPQGPFSLTASAAFLEGFPRAANGGGGGGHLHLAFVPDGEEEAAGVCLRQPDGVVVGEVFGGADPGGVRDQVARILSLDGTAAGRVLLAVRGRRLGADRAPDPDRAGGPGQGADGGRAGPGRRHPRRRAPRLPRPSPAGRARGVPGAVRAQAGQPPRPRGGGAGRPPGWGLAAEPPQGPGPQGAEAAP